MSPVAVRTLVVHMGGIGDFILACPAIRALAQEGDVILAGYADRLQLAVDGGIAQAAYSLEAIGFHSAFTHPNERLRQVLSSVDRVMVWMRDDDDVLRESIEGVCDAQVEFFPPLPPDDYPGHASTYYGDCLGLPPQDAFRLQVTALEDSLDVVIHPGSGDAKKNWPLEKFEALARCLEKEGRRVRWCLGPAEEEGMSRVPEGDRLCAETLSELARALSGAQYFIGNDSGISHLSAVLGVPTMALFSRSDPRVWGPRGARVTVLHQDSASIEDMVSRIVGE